jgi:hypothetical protein
MSNRYGGLITVGAEEDPQTGKPSRYEGITDDAARMGAFCADVVSRVANH